MRGGYRGNEGTLRTVLVGGVVVVVVIVTIVVISSALGGGKKKATPPVNKIPAARTCLAPARIKTPSAAAAPYRPKVVAASPIEKQDLKRIEKQLKKNTSSGGITPSASPSGKHLVYLNAKGRITLHTAGVARARVFPVTADDVAFNGRGNRIIYQKKSIVGNACATLVLMEMKLSGKGKHLLLSSGAFRLANAAGTPTPGVLQQDELPNGVILLIRGSKLYGFNPHKHRIAPLETPSIGALASATGSSSLSSIQFSVSPGLRYAAMSGTATQTAIYGLPSWSVQSGAVTAAPAQMAWSFDGRRLAYISPGSTSVDIRNMARGTVRKVRFPKKFGTMQVSNIRWSADDKWLGFTGSSLSGSGKLTVFITKTRGKRHLMAHAIGKTGSAASTTASTASRRH